ncbi:MAG: STAS domain-containing protein [Planctomycetota bacterium]
MKAISWQDEDATRWIQLDGELDYHVVRGIQDEFLGAVREAPGDVGVLLDGVGFVCSAALGLFIQARKIVVARGGVVRLKGLSDSVRRVLHDTNLLPHFEID